MSARPRSQTGIPGLHDRAPLRQDGAYAGISQLRVFPVFMTGLH